MNGSKKYCCSRRRMMYMYKNSNNSNMYVLYGRNDVCDGETKRVQIKVYHVILERFSFFLYCVVWRCVVLRGNNRNYNIVWKFESVL